MKSTRIYLVLIVFVGFRLYKVRSYILHLSFKIISFFHKISQLIRVRRRNFCTNTNKITLCFISIYYKYFNIKSEMLVQYSGLISFSEWYIKYKYTYNNIQFCCHIENIEMNCMFWHYNTLFHIRDFGLLCTDTYIWIQVYIRH